MISVIHAVPRDDILLGIVRADAIETNRYPASFDQLLDDVLERRRTALTTAEEERRTAARDILRNGRYKPTGRGKPASEYLIRAASENTAGFPRINSPVDICNYLSLKHVIPISVWDVDLAKTDAFVFRLGRLGEQFVFNAGGQSIDVEDLLVGCRVREDDLPREEPIVNPIKDSLLTKTTPSTNRTAACMYAPASAVSASELDAMCREFARLLEQCGEHAGAAYAVLPPGASAQV